MQLINPKLAAALKKDPDTGIKHWQRQIAQARVQAKDEDWEAAVEIYRGALAIAEVLTSVCQTGSAKARLIQTAAEYVYATRHSDIKRDSIRWSQFFSKRVQRLAPISDECLTPLKNATFQPLATVKTWVHQPV